MRAWLTGTSSIDAIAGFGLFADLTAPQLEAIIHIFDERLFAEGERSSIRACPGSGFYVIVDGEAVVIVDGAERARLGSRRLLRRGVDPARRAIDRRRGGHAPAVVPRPGGAPGRAVPDRATPRSCSGCSRRRPAGSGRRTDGGLTEPTRPFPPGTYPVVVIGSGPGGLQASYALRRDGIAHALISDDPAPGGMFRRWPHLPAAPVVDQAARSGRAGFARVRALRLEQPAGGRARGAGAPARPDGRHLLLPVAPGDGGEPRPLRRTGAHRRPLRLPLDRHAPRRRRGRRGLRRRRPPTASTAPRRWSWRSAWPSRSRRRGSAWS